MILGQTRWKTFLLIMLEKKIRKRKKRNNYHNNKESVEEGSQRIMETAATDDYFVCALEEYSIINHTHLPQKAGGDAS